MLTVQTVRKPHNRDVSQDSLWQNMEAAALRLGLLNRWQVPHALRMYMFDKRDRLAATDPRFVTHFGYSL